MRLTTSTEDRTPANLLKLVRYAVDNAGIAMSTRDAALREAHRAGASALDIAAASGVPLAAVKRILDPAPD